MKVGFVNAFLTPLKREASLPVARIKLKGRFENGHTGGPYNFDILFHRAD